MNIAISGCNGFIGSHLVRRLINDGHKIVKIDFNYGYDLTDWSCMQSLGEFEVFFHLAAKSFVPESFNSPQSFYYTNIVSTINALELCRIKNAKMIYTSSYVYGQPKYLPIDESHPVNPFNPYSQSKIICEGLCEAYYRDFKLNVNIVRPFNIYGEGQSYNFLIPTIIKQAKTGKINLKDPNPRRDWLYIDDLIEVYLKLLGSDIADFEVLNVGYGKSYSIREIVEIIQKISKIPIKAVFSGEKRKNEVLDTVADTSKLYKLVKWIPKYTLEKGLIKLMNEMGK